MERLPTDSQKPVDFAKDFILILGMFQNRGADDRIERFIWEWHL
jgi:hypothetical protein